MLELGATTYISATSAQYKGCAFHTRNWERCKHDANRKFQLRCYGEIQVIHSLLIVGGCHPRLHRRLTCKTWKVLHVRKIGLWYYKYCFWKSWETEMTSWSSWMSPPLNFQKLACQSSVFAPWSSHLLDLICRCHGPVAAIVRPDARSPDARSPPVPICPATARLSGKRLSRRLCLCRRRPSPPIRRFSLH